MKEIKEIWVPAQHICEDGTIEVYSNYEVSNLGRVKSLNYRNTKQEKIMKLSRRKENHGTYHRVHIYEKGRESKRSVHRLVLSSFNPGGYFPKAVVDHINSTPGDDRLVNLRWVTVQQNSSTEHFKMKLARQVKITFPDGHQEVFVSAKEAEHTLALPKCIVANIINYHKGHYKKKKLVFEYI